MLIRKKSLSLFALPLIAGPWVFDLHGAGAVFLDDAAVARPVGQQASHADAMLRGHPLSFLNPIPARASVVHLAVEDESARARDLAATWASVQIAAEAQAKALAAQNLSAGGWHQLLARYPWDTGLAYQVMMCESRGDPGAVNASSGATGLFQILGGPSDPVANVALAYDMYSHRGWQPWSSSRGCWG